MISVCYGHTGLHQSPVAVGPCSPQGIKKLRPKYKGDSFCPLDFHHARGPITPLNDLLQLLCSVDIIIGFDLCLFQWPLEKMDKAATSPNCLARIRLLCCTYYLDLVLFGVSTLRSSRYICFILIPYIGTHSPCFWPFICLWTIPFLQRTLTTLCASDNRYLWSEI